MRDAAFLVIGESLVDLIGQAGTWRFEATPGGSPLNVAVGLAAAGQPVRLATEVGDDLFGALVREHLARHRVATADLVVTEAPTNLAFARIDETGVAGYDFRFAWTWAGPAALAGAACLHVGSLGAVVAPGADAVRRAAAAARRQGRIVSYDPNVRPAPMGDRATAAARIEDLVAAADVVRVSADDLAWLYPGTPDLDAARRWARRCPRLVVVTRGAAGAVALHEGDLLECAAPAVEVVDTVGAGDAFTAGVLSSLAAQDALCDLPPPAVAAALRHATAIATATCAHRGGAPPAPDAVRALLAGTTVR